MSDLSFKYELTRKLRGKKAVQEIADTRLEKAVPRTHRFTIFRMGEDVCAKCGKSRAEHSAVTR